MGKRFVIGQFGERKRLKSKREIEREVLAHKALNAARMATQSPHVPLQEKKP